jgi:rhamnosyltransferase
MDELAKSIDDVSHERSKTQLAAVVVAFQPVPSQLTRLVEALARDRVAVFVMDNGGAREALADTPTGNSVVRVIDMNGNRGIGEALNLGFQLAKDDGFAYVVTFDQDSEPPLGLAAALVRAVEDLVSRGVKVAAVGPRIVDLRGKHAVAYPFMRSRMGWPSKVTCDTKSTIVETDFLITSGCVTPLSIFQRVGAFDEQLFVDCTDMEWCFRARGLGYRLFGVCGTTMPHELGTGASARAFGMTILGHSPARRYYYARNTVRLMKLPHVELGWKIRMLVGLMGRVVLLPIAVAFAAGWRKDWSLLLTGIWDGIAGVGGPLPLNRRI